MGEVCTGLEEELDVGTNGEMMTDELVPDGEGEEGCFGMMVCATVVVVVVLVVAEEGLGLVVVGLGVVVMVDVLAGGVGMASEFAGFGTASAVADFSVEFVSRLVTVVVKLFCKVVGFVIVEVVKMETLASEADGCVVLDEESSGEDWEELVPEDPWRGTNSLVELLSTLSDSAKTKFELAEDMQQQIIRETFHLVSKRDDNVCNFLEGGSLIGGSDYKLIYRHYATLYFVFCVDSSESELGILDLIQVFVETLDKCFENVCELDLIFHMDKVHYILQEVVMGGMVLETNMNEIVAQVELQNRMEKSEGGLSAAPARAVSAVKNMNLPEIPRNINIGDINIKVPSLSPFGEVQFKVQADETTTEGVF
ncbi:AP-3 complex subunit sigma-2 [Pimephales promelas]|nr:AP-3 complex subunit sigma-2 [Pimephales promelas]